MNTFKNNYAVNKTLRRQERGPAAPSLVGLAASKEFIFLRFARSELVVLVNYKRSVFYFLFAIIFKFYFHKKALIQYI
jgi:hypothetical protein